MFSTLAFFSLNLIAGVRVRVDSFRFSKGSPIKVSFWFVALGDFGFLKADFGCKGLGLGIVSLRLWLANSRGSWL